MPKQRTEFDSRLSSIVLDHVHSLVNAITVAVRKDERQTLAKELRDYLSGGNGTDRRARAKAPAARTGRKKRALGCIAPGCTNPSKGPRFHYLCDKHLGAAKKDYEAWRKAKRASA